jgi:hypothetical protein
MSETLVRALLDDLTRRTVAVADVFARLQIRSARPWPRFGANGEVEASFSDYVFELWQLSRDALDLADTMLVPKDRDAAELASDQLLAVGYAFRSLETCLAPSREFLAESIFLGVRLDHSDPRLGRRLGPGKKRKTKPTGKPVGRPRGSGHWKEDDLLVLVFLASTINGTPESDAWDTVVDSRDWGTTAPITVRKRLQNRLGLFLPKPAPRSKCRGPITAERRRALKLARLAMAEANLRRQNLAIVPSDVAGQP